MCLLKARLVGTLPDGPRPVDRIEESAGLVADGLEAGSGISMSFHSTKSSRRRYRAGARASASASGVEPSEGPLGTSRSPPRSPPARRWVRCSGGARQSPIALPDSWTCLAGRGTTTAEVAVMDVGPDLQFIANPGEAFPALMLGGPWGIEDASCPNRENPPVPTWH